MKDGSKYQRKIWFCRLLFSILQIVLFLFWPVQIRDNETCGAFMIYTVIAARSFSTDYLLMALATIPMMLYLIRFFVMLKGKQIRRLSKLPELTFIWLGGSFFLISMFPIKYPTLTEQELGGTLFINFIIIFLSEAQYLF